MQNRIYKLGYDTKSHTNQNANLCPYPILPNAMPITAHIRYYMNMISDHVELKCCCGIPNSVAHRNKAWRTNNGCDAKINLVTRDDDADKTAKARSSAGR